MESYYSFIKRTEPLDNPIRQRLERLKELTIGCGFYIVTIDGKSYQVPLKELKELAEMEKMSVEELIGALK